MRQVAGRRALVTGASRGLGAAIAIQLAGAGAHVAVTARTRADLDRVRERLSPESPPLALLPADLADPGDTERLANDACATLGGLDILVNNASTVEPLGRFGDIGWQAWERSLKVNLLACAHLSWAALRLMVPAGWGRLINISSGAASSPGILGASAYSLAKTALESLTEILAREVAGTGVTVNAVRPGVMNTAMQARMRRAGHDELDATTRARYVSLLERGGLTDPRDVAPFIIQVMESGLTGRILDIRRDRGPNGELMDGALRA